MKAKVITVGNQKGGVGKTTVAITLAGLLAYKHGKKVLIIDGCGQGTATRALSVRREPRFYDWVVRSIHIDSLIKEVPSEVYVPNRGTTSGKLFIIPGNDETRNIANSVNDVYIIHDRVEGIRNDYDYIIIDTSPAPSLLNTAIYAATEYMLFVTLCVDWSIESLIDTLQNVKRANIIRRTVADNIETAGIVPNAFFKGRQVDDVYLDQLRDNYDRVCSPIRNREIWKQAANDGRLVYAMAPSSDAAKDAISLTDEVLVIIQ